LAGKRPIYCIEAPVQHGKSKKLRYFLAWLIGRHPHKRFNFYSGDDSLRQETSMDLKDILKSLEYIAIFGNRVASIVIDKTKKATDNIDALDLKGRDKIDGKVNFRILSGGSVGYPSHFSIIDDPYSKQEQATSETQRAKVSTNYRTGVISRRQADNLIIITHSRWYPLDLIGQYINKIKAKRDFNTKVFSYPAIAIKDDKHRKKGEALFPQLRDLQFLNDQKQELTTNEFLALYQQNPRIGEDIFFKEDDLRYYDELPKFDKIAQSCDTGASDKKSSAYSVIATIGIKYTQFQDEYYLINIWREKALYPALKKAFLQQLEIYKPHQIFIEEKSSGAQIIQELQNAGNKRIVGIKPNIDKIARAAVPSEIIAQGRWFLPKEATWLDEYIEELLEFPNGAYMDQVDVTTQFLNTTVKPRITSTGFSI
jgi:predicted phage terminase large subunit-like protein